MTKLDAQDVGSGLADVAVLNVGFPCFRRFEPTSDVAVGYG
jgi:hypothetical protein